jgi:hypothetical protein
VALPVRLGAGGNTASSVRMRSRGYVRSGLVFWRPIRLAIGRKSSKSAIKNDLEEIDSDSS